MKEWFRVRFSFLLIAVIMLLGCSHTENEGDQAIVDSSMEVTTNLTSINGIPIFECYQNNDNSKPLLIVQHGLFGNKGDCLPFARKLAEKGYYVIVPDAYGHGDREGEDPKSTIDIIVTSANEYDSLIAFCIENKNVDSSRIGLIGFSMGGFMSYYYAAYGKYDIQLIAPSLSTPDWKDMIGIEQTYLRISTNKKIKITTTEEKNQINEFILEHSPIMKKEKLEKIHMLVQNSVIDPLIPYEGLEDFINEMSDIAPGFEYQLYDKTGHEVTEEYYENIIAYLAKYL